MKIHPKKFRVREGASVDLAKWPTRVDPFFKSSKDYEQRLADQIDDLGKQQALLYATDRHSILVILQAMDAAGKDGAIKHVMSGINPQGCQVFSFKQPSPLELDHDFLWRSNCRLPERGRIGIFNRSYYEEVLVARVHPGILDGQQLPAENRGDDFWKHRYQSINDMERHLHRNGTRIVKLFLHVSKEEQRRRLLDRIDDPAKNWKFSEADLKERARWDDYMRAYARCIGATSTRHAPWHVVPADDKENARLIISRIVLETLESLGMEYPKVSKARREELLALRKLLAE